MRFHLHYWLPNRTVRTIPQPGLEQTTVFYRCRCGQERIRIRKDNM